MCRCCKKRQLIALPVKGKDDGEILVCPYCDGDDLELSKLDHEED